MKVENRLPEGTKLLFAGPDVITPNTRQPVRISPFKAADVEILLEEYLAMYDLFGRLVGLDNLLVVDNREDLITEGQRKTDRAIRSKTAHIPLLNLPYLKLHLRCFPRDAHTLINNPKSGIFKVLPNERAWGNEGEELTGSLLGEGGAVLTRGNRFAVSDTLGILYERHLAQMELEGFQVGIVPCAFGLEGNFADNHLDGHVSLVEGKGNEFFLMVASSYYEGLFLDQRVDLRTSSRRLDAEIRVIDDYNLPSLAFNFVQFDDLAIAMTSNAQSLEHALKDVVGNDRVFITSKVIRLFPKLVRSSLRCLSNIVPVSYINGEAYSPTKKLAQGEFS